jgi:hypothetical protein
MGRPGWKKEIGAAAIRRRQLLPTMLWIWLTV